jgi:hypothetical protein
VFFSVFFLARRTSCCIVGIFLEEDYFNFLNFTNEEIFLS